MPKNQKTVAAMTMGRRRMSDGGDGEGSHIRDDFVAGHDDDRQERERQANSTPPPHGAAALQQQR